VEWKYGRELICSCFMSSMAFVVERLARSVDNLERHASSLMGSFGAIWFQTGPERACYFGGALYRSERHAPALLYGLLFVFLYEAGIMFRSFRRIIHVLSEVAGISH
jgi:hypothetical protein